MTWAPESKVRRKKVRSYQTRHKLARRREELREAKAQAKAVASFERRVRWKTARIESAFKDVKL